MNTEFPRIEIPLTPEEREGSTFVRAILGEAEERERHTRTLQRGMAVAMMLLGKPIFQGKPKPAPKPTAHVRHMARVKARAAYLKKA